MGVILAAAVLWFTPLIVRLGSKSDGIPEGLVIAGLLAITAGLTLCSNCRRQRWIVMIWVPLIAWTAFGCLTILSEMASTSWGGPNAAPLEGVAAAIGLVALLALGLTAILCIVWHPKVYSVPLLILAVVNTVAVSYACRTSNLQATRQDITLRILDSTGKPLPGASVKFTRYGYGPNGTDVFDAKGGPVVSDENGIAKIPSRRMRNKTEGTITKPGFRDISFTVDMQFSEWDKTRQVSISTPDTKKITWGDIPTTEPVSLTIYLPSKSDAPDRAHPRRHLKVKTDIGHGLNAAHILNLETGKFSEDPSGDIRFEIFFEMENGQYERPRVRITGLNGAKFVQVPPRLSFSGTLNAYENYFLIAPQNGYETETVIYTPGSMPGSNIYVSARGGGIYSRMKIEAWGRSKDEKAPCTVELFVNPSGSRNLE